jgi:hypothetical protein
MPTYRKGGSSRGAVRYTFGERRGSARPNNVVVKGPRMHLTEETRLCPACGTQVPSRKSDGRLAAHTVGPSRRESWMCPGDEMPPRRQ